MDRFQIVAPSTTLEQNRPVVTGVFIGIWVFIGVYNMGVGERYVQNRHDKITPE